LPGATHIEIPMDIPALETTGTPVKIKTIGLSAPDETSIRKADEYLKKAQHPVIIAGNGVLRAGATAELTSLAKKLQAPVVETFMGIGSVDARNALRLPPINLQARDWAMCRLDQTDLVIAIGYDPIDSPARCWNTNKDKLIIHIDSLPSVVDEHYVPEIEIVAGISETLSKLTQVCSPGKQNFETENLHELPFRELERYRKDTSFPLKPQKIIADLRACLGEDDILVSDVGAHKLWLARLYPAYKPDTFIISNGFAPVGFALPATIGVKLARPQSKVVAVCGDGGFLINSQELETAKRLEIPLVIMVWVDSSFGLIEWKQVNKFGNHYGVRFDNPDLVKYAESFGLHGYKVEKASDLKPVLQKALQDNMPSVIEVPVDYNENHRLAEDLY
jgi:acetolactate synthase-1/2/3 large subunit